MAAGELTLHISRTVVWLTSSFIIHSSLRSSELLLSNVRLCTLCLFRNVWHTPATTWENRPLLQTRKKKMWVLCTVFVPTWHCFCAMIFFSFASFDNVLLTSLSFCPRLLKPFEVDLSHVYLAYTEESMRQSLMKLERPRTSKSGKSGRPKTGRR